MTTQEALNISIEDFNRMKRADLAKVVSILARTANKRIDTLKQYEQSGRGQVPALRSVEKLGKFYTKGKTLGQLRSEYSRARAFLKLKTSTVKGVERVKQESTKKLRDAGIKIDSKEDVAKAWELYNRVAGSREFQEKYMGVIDSDIVRKLVFKTVAENKDMSIDDLYDRVIENLDKEYESTQVDFSGRGFVYYGEDF